MLTDIFNFYIYVMFRQIYAQQKTTLYICFAGISGLTFLRMNLMRYYRVFTLSSTAACLRHHWVKVVISHHPCLPRLSKTKSCETYGKSLTR